MHEIERILERLALADRRAAVWCAAQCVRAMLHLVPDREPRPKKAVEVAEAWVRGEATEEACREAANVLDPGDIDLHEHAANIMARAAHWTARAAAHSADAPRLVPLAVRYVIRAADDADAAWGEVGEGCAPRLLALVRSERWPRTFPTAEQLAAAPEAVAVAWDAVADDRPDHSIPELLEAHARAERLGLDWSDPVARAVAERATDEARVRGLLSPRGAP